MEREDLLRNPEYWIANAQIMLYNCADSFMKSTGKNRTQLAEHLGVSKGYVSQLLNGDYDHKLSKLVELSLAFGYIPKLNFIPFDEYIEKDSFMKNKKELYNSNYETAFNLAPMYISKGDEYGLAEVSDFNNVA